MPIPFASLRIFGRAAAILGVLVSGTVQGQQTGVFPYRWTDVPPADAITPADVREALMWTGHLDFVFKGELAEAVRKATNAWQKSKGQQQTDKLTEGQTSQLVQEGLKEREAVGWSTLHDPAVGFAIGVPTKLVTFGTPRIDGGTLFYSGGGAISQSIGIHHGYPTCRTMDALYPKTTAGASFRARRDNWFVALFRHGETSSYLKVTCHSTGTISTEMTVPVDILEKHRGLFAAMAGSLVLMRTPDPTVRPRPRVDELPLAPTGFSDQQTARPQAKAKPAKPSTIDDSGKTVALRLETRDGPDLRAEDVFDKASGAVYVVKADRRLGSAVAISDNELLTNCHVTGDLPEVKIARAKDEMPAKVISRNADADRCVLRTDTKLAKWVTVRPYDDIKVGERAITIGTPQGLELTAAEGIVSSKRLYNQTRVVQTSAPISQGSSGGGLFDARGHLLGITTFYFRGGQNLNFAVAAEEYAQDREESATR
ncbi:MAG TPA: serine protease [Reyranella sp.]|nr:serine protease [Reyranella sp.]